MKTHLARAAYVILVIAGFPFHVVMTLINQTLRRLGPYTAIDGKEKS